jgi:hypothetical protein
MMRWNFSDEHAYHSYLKDSQLIRSLLLWLMISLIGVVSWFGSTFRSNMPVKRELDTAKLARKRNLPRFVSGAASLLFNSQLDQCSGRFKPEEARKIFSSFLIFFVARSKETISNSFRFKMK